MNFDLTDADRALLESIQPLLDDTSLPDLGDSASSVMSPARERELGKAFMRSVRRSQKVIDDPLITDYAQQQLGDVVYVELPTVGKAIAKGGEAAVVESVKAASEVYAPVSGEVVEVNEALPEDPGLVNRDCYGEGWMYKLKLEDGSALAGLLDAEGYESLLAEEDG